MARQRLLSVLVLANALVSVLSCGSGGPSPCSWTTCRHEWRNDWGPGISQGRCVNQRRNAHHITSSHSGSGSCPSPSGCSPQTQYRTMCKYSIVWFRCGVGESWNPFNCYRCLDLTNRSRRELFQISDIQIFFCSEIEFVLHKCRIFFTGRRKYIFEVLFLSFRHTTLN